jgi:hypothetical protein
LALSGSKAKDLIRCGGGFDRVLVDKRIEWQRTARGSPTSLRLVNWMRIEHRASIRCARDATERDGALRCVFRARFETLSAKDIGSEGKRKPARVALYLRLR